MSKMNCKVDITDDLVLNLEDGLYGLEDKNGEVLLETEYNYISTPIDGLLMVESEEGLCGYVSEAGEEVVPIVFYDIDTVECGFIRVKGDHGWGVYGVDGELVIPLTYEDISIVSDTHIQCKCFDSNTYVEFVVGK